MDQPNSLAGEFLHDHEAVFARWLCRKRQQALRFVASRGGLTTDERLRSELMLSHEGLRQVLDCEAFRRVAGCVALSEEGRLAARALPEETES